MSAAELRQAAALMRSRAEAANAGPWTVTEASDEYDDYGYLAEIRSPTLGHGREQDDLVASVVDRAEVDAVHIASWHPTVALAVADWLDDLYERITDTDYDEDDDLAAALRGEADTSDWPDVHRALTVARTYLGTTP